MLASSDSGSLCLCCSLALADYWSREVWIISQVPLMPGHSQVINWIAHGGVRWVGLETLLPCTNHPNCHVLTEQFADSACSNYTICWPGRYCRFTQYNHRAGPLTCMAAVVQVLINPSICFPVIVVNALIEATILLLGHPNIWVTLPWAHKSSATKHDTTKLITSFHSESTVHSNDIDISYS